MSKRGRPKKGTVKTKESTKWTTEEDEKLRDLVSTEPIDWDVIAESFPNKTKTKCAQRWAKILNPILKKGPWSNEEDEKILSLVEKYGAKKWSFIASHLNGRVGKQCRERWHNHLNPVINKDPWTESEDELIIEKQKEMGNKWSKICTFLNGRTDNMVKNRWNSTLKRKLNGNTKTNKKRNIKANTEVKAKKQKVDIKKFTTPKESTIKKELDMESPSVDRRSGNLMEDEEGDVGENNNNVERTPERTHLKFEEMEIDPQTPLTRSYNNNNGEFNLFSTPKEEINTERTFVACVYSGGNEISSPSILYKKEQETNISMPQSPQIPNGFSFSPQLKTNTPQPPIKFKVEPFSPSLLFGTPVCFKESLPVYKESLLNSSEIQNKEILQSSNKQQQKPRNKSLLKQSFKNKYNSILEGKPLDSPNNTPNNENNNSPNVNNNVNSNSDNTNFNNNNNDTLKISGKITDSPNTNSPNVNKNSISNEDFSFNTPNNTFKNNNHLSLTPFFSNYNNLFVGSPNISFESPLLLKELHSNSPFAINNDNNSKLENNQVSTSSTIINGSGVRKTPFSELFSPKDFPSLKNQNSSPLQVLSEVSTSPFRYISPESNTPGSTSKKNIFMKLKCEESILPSNNETSFSNNATPNHQNTKSGIKTPNSVNGKFKLSFIDNIHVKSNKFTLKFVDSDESLLPPSPHKSLVINEPSKPTSLVYTLNSNKVIDQIDKNNKDVMYKRAESLINPVKLEQKENVQNSMI